MTELVVRRLLVDLETPIERHWCGGDAFRTALFNALSMSFPVGEQFFIDSVRDGLKALPESGQQRFRSEVQGFIGQEATHRRLHALFNAHLEKQGLVNAWGPRALARQEMLRGVDVRHPVAITAANEHITAVLSDYVLRHPGILDGSEPRLQALWSWHSAEESEHKSTAFDLYLALGGSEEWRRRWFRRITIMFLADVVRQTLLNLRHDGTLWRWRTWRSAASTLFGRRGVIRRTTAPWREYGRPGFHPRQQDSTHAERWLAEHQDQFTPVRT